LNLFLESRESLDLVLNLFLDINLGREGHTYSSPSQQSSEQSSAHSSSSSYSLFFPFPPINNQ
jgi:hypothetical protein